MAATREVMAALERPLSTVPAARECRREPPQRLRGRVVGNHIRANTAASTFRTALAALLREERGYQPRLRIDPKGRRKYVLPRDREQRPGAWQDESLRVTWAECAEPYAAGLEVGDVSHA